MAEVAQLAGVSVATVSRALSAPEKLSAKSRLLVEKAIIQLDYRPSPLAGVLAGGKPRLVAVVLPTIANSFFAEFLQTLASGFAAAGYQIMVDSHEFNLDREAEIVASFLSWDPALLVTTGLHHSRRGLALLAGARCPVFEMWDLDGNPVDNALGFSNRQVGAKLGELLVANPDRRFAFIGAVDVDPRARARSSGFADGIKRVSGQDVIVQSVEARTPAAGRIALRKVLETTKGRPISIAFSSDAIALGALFEAQRLGISVPDTLEMIGYGNLNFAEEMNPRLSSVALPHRAAAEAIVDAALRLKSGQLEKLSRSLNPEFLLRETTLPRAEAFAFDR